MGLYPCLTLDVVGVTNFLEWVGVLSAFCLLGTMGVVLGLAVESNPERVGGDALVLLLVANVIFTLIDLLVWGRFAMSGGGIVWEVDEVVLIWGPEIQCFWQSWEKVHLQKMVFQLV